MDYARYVGRVGALAVALGIGAAVSAGPTAWADSDGPKSPGNAASSESGTTSPPRGDADTARASVRRASMAPRTVRSHTHSTPGQRSALRPTDTLEAAEVSDPAPSVEADDRDQPVDSQQTADSPEIGVPVSNSSPVISTPNAFAAAPVATAATVKPAARSLVTLTRKLVDAILAPFARPLPTTPLSSPLLLMVEWFRRTTVGSFYNRGPEAAPMQIGENAAGVVIGTIGATDPDGDPLAYRVSQAPTRGTVVVRPDGTYVYTPDAAMARDGGTDTFTVSVGDGGFRLLSQPGRTSVSVAVEVGAGDSLAINGTPFAVAMSPDGRRVYVTDPANNRISVIDIATRSVTGSIDVGGEPLGIAIAADGRGYVVNSADGTITVFDTATDRVVRPYVYVGSSPTGIAVNANGTRVVVANSYEDSVSVIDTGTWTVSRVVVGDGPYGVAISGDRALITNELADTVSVVDLTTNTVIATITVGDAPTGIAAAGNRAIVTNAGTLTTPGDGTITIIDLDTLNIIGSPIALGDSPVSVVIDGTGTTAYIADADRSTITTLDISNGTITDSRGTAVGPTGMAIGTDGALYLAGYTDGTIDPVDVGAIPLAAMVAARASVAAAAPAPTQEWSTVTSGFDLYNDTLEDLIITYEGPNRPNGGGPAEGTILAPGAHLHLEVPAKFGGFKVTMVMTTPAGEVWNVGLNATNLLGLVGGGTIIRHFDVDGTFTFFDLRARTKQFYEYGTPPYVRFRGLPTPPTILTADDPEAAALLSACAKSSQAKCTWHAATEPTQEWTDWQPATAPNGTPVAYYNDTPKDSLRSFVVSTVVTQKLKDAVTGGNVAGVMFWQDRLAQTNEAARIYKNQDDAHRYKGVTPDYTVPAGSTLQVQMRAPVLRHNAYTAITIGNSTTVITGLVYELPDLKRELEFRPVITPGR